jgi:23S rRNA (cytidine2498-2'-O)-methyltransferase
MTAYLAFKGFEKELKHELKQSVRKQWDRLFFCEGEISTPIWAQDIWSNAHLEKIDSIGDAAKKLKVHGKFWVPYSFELHRRSALIQEKLMAPRTKPIKFLQKISAPPYGVWSLIDKDQILYSPSPSSLLPLGEYTFEEDKEFPPSRAYLKLWELFTVHGIQPSKEETVVDLGSSPGGWTWVLQQVGCHVLSVDKAPLDAKIQKLPRIESIKKDAFKLAPSDLGGVTWLFSDIICYPEKLWIYLQPWLSKPVHLVCTIKFQGKTDWETLEKFKKVPGGRIIHLYHNKHEVTFIRLAGIS